MSGAKVRKMLKKSGINDISAIKNLLTDGYNIEIIFPKYIKAYESAKKYRQHLDIFLKAVTMMPESERRNFSDKSKYIDKTLSLFDTDVIKIGLDKHLETEDFGKIFKEKQYNWMKGVMISDFIIEYKHICKIFPEFVKSESDQDLGQDLARLTKHIADNLMLHTDLSLFTFAKAGVSNLNEGRSSIRYLTSFILNYMENLKVLYDIYTTPDINVQRVCDMMNSLLHTLEKTIPRCELGFKVLYRSLDKLKNNFDRYYNKFVTGGKSSSIFIMEYMIDVYKDQNEQLKKNAMIMFQIKKIITTLIERAKKNLQSQGQGQKMDNQMISKMYELLDKIKLDDSSEFKENPPVKISASKKRKIKRKKQKKKLLELPDEIPELVDPLEPSVEPPDLIDIDKLVDDIEEIDISNLDAGIEDLDAEVKKLVDT